MQTRLDLAWLFECDDILSDEAFSHYVQEEFYIHQLAIKAGWIKKERNLDD